MKEIKDSKIMKKREINRIKYIFSKKENNKCGGYEKDRKKMLKNEIERYLPHS